MRRKRSKVLLAGALAAALTVTPVSIVTAAPGDATAASGNATTAPGGVTAAPGDYIVFLPKEEGVEYTYDSGHMSEEYSTDAYTVLLYKPGEMVSFQVTSEKEFTVEDALKGDPFTSASILDNGVVAFTMPGTDLCCDFTADEEETETESDSDNTEKAEPGTFKIKLGKKLSATCTMVDKSEKEIKAGGNYKGTDMVDMIRVSAEKDLEEEPTIRVYKNGDELEDISDVVISKGLSKNEFVVDFKNTLPLDSDSYVVRITLKGADKDEETETSSGTETADETEASTDGAAAETAATTETNAAGSVNAYFAQAGTETGVTDSQQTEAPTETPAETASDAAGAGVAGTQEGNVTGTTETETATGTVADTQETVPETPDTAAQPAETAVQGETMSTMGVVGDDYQEDSVVSSFVSGFADTVRETATAVNVTVTNNIPDLPLIVKKSDGKVEVVTEASYMADDGISEIEFIGDMVYAPQIVVLKDGEEMDAESSIVKEQKCLENGNLFMEFKPAGEIEPGNYEIKIG